MYPIERYQAPKMLDANEMEKHAHRWLHGKSKYMDAENNTEAAAEWFHQMLTLERAKAKMAGLCRKKHPEGGERCSSDEGLPAACETGAPAAGDDGKPPPRKTSIADVGADALRRSSQLAWDERRSSLTAWHRGAAVAPRDEVTV